MENRYKIVIALLIVTFILFVAAYLNSYETRPIYKFVPYESPIVEPHILYSVTLTICDDLCWNFFGFSIPYVTQTRQEVYNDIISTTKVKEDSVYRYNYKLCDINNICTTYKNILNIENTVYYKNIQIGNETKYRKELNGFETKKVCGWWLGK